MTQIQIQYQNMLETKRHDVATEVQAANELAETGRHNRVTEGETKRHNVTTETESHRHNVKTEQLTQKQNAETHRHNIVTEKETVRSHKATESINRTAANARAAESYAKANKYNADAMATQITNALRKANPNMDWVNTFGKNFDKKALTAIASTAAILDQAGVSSSEVIQEAAKAAKVVYNSSGKIGVSYTNPDKLAEKFLKTHSSDPRYNTVSKKEMSKAFEEVLNVIGDTLVGGPITAPSTKRNVK